MRPVARLHLTLSLVTCTVSIAVGALLLAGCGRQAADEESTVAPDELLTEESTDLASEPRAILGADDLEVEAGECTTLEWETEGVLKAYLDQRGIELSGSEEVCPSETMTYTLMAVLADGELITRTLTIEVATPTSTPTPTSTATETRAPVTFTPVPSETPTPAPTVEVYVRFYAKNHESKIPADDLCTEVIWETSGVTDLQLEREGHGRMGVGPNGREQVCFEGDKVKMFLYYRLPDGREERAEVEIRRAEPEEPEEPEETEEPAATDEPSATEEP